MDEELLSRQQPQSLEAEQAVLGSILIDSRCVADVIGIVKPEDFFLEQNRSRMGLGSLRLSADAQAALLHYDWPGNVRELEHLIGRSALKALGRCNPRPRILTLTAADLELPTTTTEPAAPVLGSCAPKTTRGTRACSMAPLHMAQGSRVT